LNQSLHLLGLAAELILSLELFISIYTLKMRDNILLTYALVDILFLVSGVLLLAFALTTESMGHQTPTVTTAARDIILKQAAPVSGQSPSHRCQLVLTELPAAIGNAVLVFITFLISIAAMVMPMTRGWLKLNGYMTAVCALFTMILGLSMWVDTLRTRSNLSVVWADQPASTQSLIQQAVSRNLANVSSSPLTCNS
jgi:hypothetical protein